MRPDVEEYYVFRAECLLQFCDFNSSIANYEHALSITGKLPPNLHLLYIYYISNIMVCRKYIVHLYYIAI